MVDRAYVKIGAPIGGTLAALAARRVPNPQVFLKPKLSLHPPTSIMVKEAIEKLNNKKKGSSVQAIKKYITETFDVNPDRQTPYLKRYLKKAVESGELIQVSGKGASGSFKFPNVKSTKPKVSPKVVMPTVKVKELKKKNESEKISSTKDTTQPQKAVMTGTTQHSKAVKGTAQPLKAVKDTTQPLKAVEDTTKPKKKIRDNKGSSEADVKPVQPVNKKLAKNLPTHAEVKATVDSTTGDTETLVKSKYTVEVPQEKPMKLKLKKLLQRSSSDASPSPEKKEFKVKSKKEKRVVEESVEAGPSKPKKESTKSKTQVQPPEPPMSTSFELSENSTSEDSNSTSEVEKEKKPKIQSQERRKRHPSSTPPSTKSVTLPKKAGSKK